MDLDSFLSKQWSVTSIVPLPTVVIGPLSGKLITELATSRPKRVVLNTELIAKDILTVIDWVARRDPKDDWVGIAVLLDRIGTARAVRSLVTTLVDYEDVVGLVFSWESGSVLPEPWKPLADRCVRHRMRDDTHPVPLVGIRGDQARATVVSVLNALAHKDHTVLERVLSQFTVLEMVALEIWIHEAITGAWDYFSAADSSGFQNDKPFLMGLMKSMNPLADPRILAKSIFLPMVLR